MRRAVAMLWLVSGLAIAPGCAQPSTYPATTGHATAASGTTGAGAGTSSGAAATSSSSGSTAEVSGTALDTYVTDTGTVSAPEDLSQSLIQALVLTDGGFTTFTGLGTSDGGFTIPNVPAGPFLLQESALYVYTSDRTFDLGHVLPHRPGATPIAVNPTDAVFDVTGMTPWRPGDWLELHSTNTGDAYSFADVPPINPPNDAGTTLDSLTYNLNDVQPAYLLDSADGDSLFLSHLCVESYLPTTVVRGLCEVFNAPTPFDEVNGQPLTFSGSFTPASGSSLALDWGVSQLEAQGTGTNPNATGGKYLLSVYGIPGGLGYGDYVSQASSSFFNNVALASANYAVGTTGVDVDLGTVTYGDPFPTSWGTFVQVFGAFATSYALPGTTPLAYGAFILAQYDATALPGGALGPLVGPASSPQVNGKNAFDDLTGITQTPVFSWRPPTTGTAVGYEVLIQWLQPKAGITYSTLIARLYTKETSVPIPPDLLIEGQSYLFELRAIAMPGIDLEASPLRLAFPRGFSALTTGLLSP